MKRYLLYGPNGAGKSTIGEELKSHGYDVIEADHYEGLSSWINKTNGQMAKHEPPFTAEWVENHEWRWDESILNEILDDKSRDTIFVVGGAHNLSQFMNRFDKRFYIYTDFDTALPRLKKREPERWLDGSAEVKRLHRRTSEAGISSEKKPGDTVINNSGTVAQATDKILEEINA